MINLFPVYDKIDDEEVERVGKLKTGLFIGSFLLAVLLAAIFYSTAELTITRVSENPTYSTYQELYDNNDVVSCECRNVSHTIASFTTVTNPPDAFCTDAHSKLTNVCQGYYGAACNGSSTESFFKSLVTLCEMSFNTLNQQIESLSKQLVVTDQLLHASALERRVFSMGELSVTISESILESNHKLIDAMNSIDRPLLHTFWEVSNKQFDAYTQGGDQQYEIGSVNWPTAIDNDGSTSCNCADAWACKINVDLSSDVGGYGIRYCSIFETIMKNPVKVWSSEQFFRNGIGFNIDITDAATLQQFPEIGNLYSNHQSYGILLSQDSTYYSDELRKMYQEGMSGQLSADVNHQSYYNLCNPSKCEYTSKSSRSGIEILAVLAGLIGGFKVAIDMMVNICCMKKQQKVVKKFRNERKSQMEILRKSQSQIELKTQLEAANNDAAANDDKKSTEMEKYAY